MWMIYSFSSCKLVTSFPTFSILILSGKNGKSFRSLRKFLEYWTSTSRKYPSSLSSLYFYIKSSLNWEVSLIHSFLFTGSFCSISQPYKFFKCQYLSYDDSLFQSQSSRYLLLACAYWWIALHIPLVMHISTINQLIILI